MIYEKLVFLFNYFLIRLAWKISWSIRPYIYHDTVKLILHFILDEQSNAAIILPAGHCTLSAAFNHSVHCIQDRHWINNTDARWTGTFSENTTSSTAHSRVFCRESKNANANNGPVYELVVEFERFNLECIFVYSIESFE